MIKIYLRAWDEVASFAVHRNKKLRSFHFGASLELPARFELATGFHEIHDFTEAFRPLFWSALRAWDEVASFAVHRNKKLRSFHFGVSLELLARFELATSSLPRTAPVSQMYSNILNAEISLRVATAFYCCLRMMTLPKL